jgi:hypothetical protein
MATSDTFTWERSVLGEHIVYPSHPLVLACMIMERYQSFAHAARNDSGDKHGFSNASSDSFIPGAGCAVSSSMRALELGLSGNTDAAIALAHDYIEGYRRQNASNEADSDQAQRQGEKVKERFLSHIKVWGTPAMPESPVRLPDVAIAA